MNDFYAGKVAFITGAASGIGLALTRSLLQRRCHVIATDIDAFPANIDVPEGTQLILKQLDVRDQSAFQQVFDETLKPFGQLHFMFNNAGIAIGGPAHQYSAEEWSATTAVNITGVTNGIHLAYALMRAQGHGHIINTSSIVGRFPNVLTPMYSASKAAITVLTEQLRVEAQPFGVHFHAILPGAVDTPILLGGSHGRGPHGVSKSRLQRFWQKLHPISAEELATQALVKIAADKGEIIIPSRWRYYTYIYRFFPFLWRIYSKNQIVFSKKIAQGN